MENITIPRSEYEQLLKYKYAATAFKEELHEREFKASFVNEVEQISSDVKKGKKTTFKTKEEFDKFMREL